MIEHVQIVENRSRQGHEGKVTPDLVPDGQFLSEVMKGEIARVDGAIPVSASETPPEKEPDKTDPLVAGQGVDPGLVWQLAMPGLAALQAPAAIGLGMGGPVSASQGAAHALVQAAAVPSVLGPETTMASSPESGSQIGATGTLTADQTPDQTEPQSPVQPMTPAESAVEPKPIPARGPSPLEESGAPGLPRPDATANRDLASDGADRQATTAPLTQTGTLAAAHIEMAGFRADAGPTPTLDGQALTMTADGPDDKTTRAAIAGVAADPTVAFAEQPAPQSLVPVTETGTPKAVLAHLRLSALDWPGADSDWTVAQSPDLMDLVMVLPGHLPSRQAALGFRLTEFGPGIGALSQSPGAAGHGDVHARPGPQGAGLDVLRQKDMAAAGDGDAESEPAAVPVTATFPAAAAETASSTQIPGGAMPVEMAALAARADAAITPPSSDKVDLSPPAPTLAATPAPPLRQPDVLTGQVAHLILNRAEDRAELLLEPAELGRLRFEITHRGDGVQILLSAERPETLELLRRHSDQLMGEIRAMGFDGADIGFGSWGGGQARPDPIVWSDPAPDPDISFAPSPQTSAPSARITGSGGLDLRL